ncbi:MAG: hypothetical protein LAO07_14035 [Acidobacteriia bacterium]|nr:hypothetical protein [Terriglobia bacterium]
MRQVVRHVLIEEEGDQQQDAVDDEWWPNQNDNGAQPAVEGDLRERDQVQGAGNQAPDNPHPQTEEQQVHESLNAMAMVEFRRKNVKMGLPDSGISPVPRNLFPVT